MLLACLINSCAHITGIRQKLIRHWFWVIFGADADRYCSTATRGHILCDATTG